jgi:hypothetical protein
MINSNTPRTDAEEQIERLRAEKSGKNKIDL